MSSVYIILTYFDCEGYDTPEAPIRSYSTFAKAEIYLAGLAYLPHLL